MFLDGVGIGSPDPETNPFFRARLPAFRRLLDGELPHLSRRETGGERARAFPLDPLLGVEGLPQSGTGQTALLTGENAPALHGNHFGPWVPVALRPLLQERNLLSRALSLGLTCAFANAHPSRFMRFKEIRRPAGPPLAAYSAGLLTRDETYLAEGKAVSSEIVNTTWRERLGFSFLPEVTPAQAGENLARISRSAQLTLFAHYSTDLAGHTGRMADAVQVLERLDAFLGSLSDSVSSSTLLVIASDHGNIEDVGGGHTLNPTLTMLVGNGSTSLREGLTRITDLCDLILTYLGGAGEAEPA